MTKLLDTYGNILTEEEIKEATDALKSGLSRAEVAENFYLPHKVVRVLQSRIKQ